ncbi:portal protein [Caudoviricetes sp.]|nr:portal protein [Caudoviricetes sp.]
MSEKPKNYADDEKVRARVLREIVPLINEVRTRKQVLNQMWHSFTKVWTMEHDRQGYLGRSNLYIPAGRKGVETLTAQLVSGTFPVDDPFNVTPRFDEFADQALTVKGAVEWGLAQAQVRARAEAYYRSLLITGNAVTKDGWRTKKVNARVRGTSKDKYKDSKLFLAADGFTDVPTTVFDGPTFDLKNPANIYVWPETVQDLREAALVFEDMSMTYRDLYSECLQGRCQKEQLELVKAGEKGDQTTLNEQQKLESQGIPNTEASGRTAPARIDVTEIWLDFDPAAESWDLETNDTVRPMVILVTSKSGKVLKVMDNPFNHQTPPYSVGRIGVIEGRFWGSGQVETIRDLQALLNDQTNQGTDCATYHLNPQVVANPNLLVGEVADIEPGAIQYVLDINNGIKFDRPPGDLIQSAAILTSQTTSWMQDYIGAPPVLSGGSAPGRAFRSATGIGTAQRNAQVPLQEIIRACETETWEPTLRRTWFGIQQFASDELLLKVSGKAVRVPVTELVGDYMFKWWASSQAQNTQVKGTQLTQLLNILASPNMQALLKQSGIKLNPKPLLKKLYEEVFGFRDIDDVLVNEVMGAAGMQVSGQVPNIGDGNGQMLPENPLGGNEQTEEGVSGTQGGEFAGNRAEANDIAAQLGAAMGG